MKFRCDCLTHILKVENFSGKKIKGIWIAIYNIYSPKGRKYKKPKLISDVVIMNNYYKKECDKLFAFLESLSKK